MSKQSKTWHEIKFADTKGKEKIGRHNNSNNNKGKKKALRLLFIQTFKTITRGSPEQNHKEVFKLLFNLRATTTCKRDSFLNFL